jgi:zinc finger protein
MSECENRMVVTAIPKFKEVIIMAITCDNCGYRSNEVRVGGGISTLATRYVLNVQGEEDLKRDVLKSETSALVIPELQLELSGPALGGRFTTVEGLLEAIRDQLEENPFLSGDSAARKEHFQAFLARIDALRNGQEKFTLILDDPVSNAYIQPLDDPDKPDERVRVFFVSFVSYAHS